MSTGELSRDCDDFYGETSVASPAPSKTGTKTRPKPKVSHKWTPAEVHKLIEMVKDHQCIWNFKLKEHKNMNQREASWNIIDEEMGGFGITELKAKWTNVTTTYRTTKAKMFAHKSGQGANKPIHWEYWSDMQFMNINESASNTVSDSNLEFDSFALSQLEDFDGDDSAGGSSSTLSYAPTPTLAAAGSGIAQRKRKVSTPMPSASKELLMQRAILALDKKDDDDEWQKFGDYIASDLRKMATTNSGIANRTKNKIARNLLDSWDDAEAGTSTLAVPNVGMIYNTDEISSVLVFNQDGEQLDSLIEMSNPENDVNTIRTVETLDNDVDMTATERVKTRSQKKITNNKEN